MPITKKRGRSDDQGYGQKRSKNSYDHKASSYNDGNSYSQGYSNNSSNGGYSNNSSNGGYSNSSNGGYSNSSSNGGYSNNGGYNNSSRNNSYGNNSYGNNKITKSYNPKGKGSPLTPSPAHPNCAKRPADEKGNFSVDDFPLSNSTKTCLLKRGIKTLFPIQAATFDFLIEGNDLVGRARTGTGKTLAFSLPIIERLLADNTLNTKQRGRAPRVLVLCPTRELAKQVASEFESLSKQLSFCCFYGGTSIDPQRDALRRGTDIVVGTPGRIIDLINRGNLILKDLDYFILDEADQMLDIGFAQDIDQILDFLPPQKEKQVLLFSATVPQWVQSIAQKHLKPSRKVVDLVGSQKLQVSTTVQHYVLRAYYTEKPMVVAQLVSVYGGGKKGRTIVFTETKKEANELALNNDLKATCDCFVLHGGIQQKEREVTIKSFKNGGFNVLIATNVVARGIDIDGIELVIQYEPPSSVETYIHRSGRTGRAGKSGIAVTLFDRNKEYLVKNIERKAKLKFSKMSVPSTKELIGVSLKTCDRKLKSVNKKVIPYYLDKAKELLANNDPTEVLAEAIACMTGITEPIQNRSLLDAQKGCVTVQLVAGFEIQSKGFIWTQIRNCLFQDTDNKVWKMTMFADKTGAVFDIPSKYMDKVRELKNTGKIKIEICEDLPELEQSNNQRGGGGRGGWRSRGGRSGGYGGGNRRYGGNRNGGGRWRR